MFTPIIRPLARPHWLTADRLRTYGLIVMVALAAAVTWITFAHYVVYRSGEPFGGDFLSFYTASKLALAGDISGVWNRDTHSALQYSLFPSETRGYFAFFYPPPYLLLCWPLALLPFDAALWVWLGLSTGAALWLMRLVLHRLNVELTGIWPVMLAFPALWLNLMCGQNGALSLAILGGGCLLMDRRPLWAGLVLGLLVYKPQMAVVLPFALMAAGRWKTFFATGASAAVCLTLSFFVVGREGFEAFLAVSGTARETLLQGKVDPAFMLSLYSALFAQGAPAPIALTGQILLSLSALAVTMWVLFRSHAIDGLAFGALLIPATLLVSPFSLHYDLMITGLPIGWLAVRGAQQGYRPWEQMILLLAALLPLFSYALGQVKLPLAPVVLTALFAFAALRVYSMYSGALTRLPSSIASATMRRGLKSASD